MKGPAKRMNYYFDDIDITFLDSIIETMKWSKTLLSYWADTGNEQLWMNCLCFKCENVYVLLLHQY